MEQRGAGMRTGSTDGRTRNARGRVMEPPTFGRKQTIVLAVVFFSILAIAIALAVADSIAHPRRSDAGTAYFRQMSGSSKVIATGDSFTLTEGEVAARVIAFQERMGIDNEKAWAAWLAKQGKDDGGYYAYVLKRMVREDVVAAAAAQEGIEISDEEVAAGVAALREAFEGSSHTGDNGSDDAAAKDERWEQAKAAAQTDGATYEEATRMAMQEAALAEVAAGKGMSFDDYLAAAYEDQHVVYSV